MERIVKKYVKGALMLAAIALFLWPLTSMAATVTDLNKQKSVYAAQVEAARKKAEQKQREAEALKVQINSIDGQITATEQALEDTKANISVSEDNIAALKAKIETEEDNLARENDQLDKVISSWYMQGDQSGLVNALLGSDTLSEVVTKQEYYDSIKNQIAGSIEKIEKLKSDLEVQKSEQDQKNLELKKLFEIKSTQRNGLAYQENVKNRLLNDTTATIAQLKEEEQKATALERQVESQINSLLSSRTGNNVPRGGAGIGIHVNQGDIIGYEGNTGYSTGPHLHFMVFLDGNLSNHRNPRNYLGGALIWPMDNFRVTQEYGWTDYAAAGAYGGSPHTGIDLSQYLGAPIKAAASGTIILRQYFGGYGNAIVIEHENGIYTLYGHTTG